jgi:hypothetical protein
MGDTTVKYLRLHSNRAKRFLVLPLALAALVGYISIQSSDFARQAEAQSSFEQLSRSSDSLKTTREALDQAIVKEKLAPSVEASRAADAALKAYNESRAERLKAITMRRQELESSVRAIVSSMGIDTKRVREAPETAFLMAEHEELTEEFVALSYRTPVGELERNDSIATADRIIGGGAGVGARSGVIAPGDADYYSIEAEAGQALDFQIAVKPVSGKKSGRVTFDLLAPDGMTILFSRTGEAGKASSKPSSITVAQSGKYYVEVKTNSSRRTLGYELMVKRSGGDFSTMGNGPPVCTTADFEGGADGFTVEPVFDMTLWHLSTTCGAELPGHSTPTTFYYGIECNTSSSMSAGATFSSQSASGSTTTSLE